MMLLLRQPQINKAMIKSSPFLEFLLGLVYKRLLIALPAFERRHFSSRNLR